MQYSILFKMNKTVEYNRAMEKYFQYSYYHKMSSIMSALIVFLQIFSIFMIADHFDLSLPKGILILLLAFISADLINGFIHMVMDNNTNYSSFLGPFVAAFHLHHKQPKYTTRNIFKVYYDETGSKFWLAGYMVILVVIQASEGLNTGLEFYLVSFSILSSIAEVSHYLCHNSRSSFVTGLRRLGILLSPIHHLQHHSKDNVNYAFLNGMSDPFLNWVARYCCAGYKHNADTHSRTYHGPQMSNRS